jgi:hypothetical protein
VSKYKAGLHKEVSAIFNGVSPPNPARDASRQNDGAQRPSAAPARRDSGVPKPPVPEPPPQKLPVPSHMTPTKPKPEQPPPKASPAKQSKADAIIKAIGQIPWRRTLEQIKNKLFATKTQAITTKQKIVVILAPVLFVVLIFVFIQVFSAPSRKITGAGPSGRMVAVVGVDNKVDWQIPNPYPATLRDPMQFSSATSHAGDGGLVVKGIIYSEDNPSAVIGDQIVHQGDKVLDVIITKINENSVEFEAGNKKWIQNVQR